MLDRNRLEGYNGNMMSLEIALSPELQRYVDARVAQEGFADTAEFLRDLVQRDQDIYETDVRRVRAMIQEGIDSGVLDAEPEEIIREIIAETRDEHD